MKVPASFRENGETLLEVEEYHGLCKPGDKIAIKDGFGGLSAEVQAVEWETMIDHDFGTIAHSMIVHMANVEQDLGEFKEFA